MLSEKQKENLVQEGYKLLKLNKGYSQRRVVSKLNYLGHKTNVTAFNQINKKKAISSEALVIIFQGMEKLLKNEICHVINKKIQDCR